MNHKLVLKLDDSDMVSIMKAIAERDRFPVPHGSGNMSGRLLAEICRGWLEYISQTTEPPTATCVTGKPWLPSLNVSGGRVWFGDPEKESDSDGDV